MSYRGHRKRFFRLMENHLKLIHLEALDSLIANMYMTDENAFFGVFDFVATSTNKKNALQETY